VVAFLFRGFRTCHINSRGQIVETVTAPSLYNEWGAVYSYLDFAEVRALPTRRCNQRINRGQQNMTRTISDLIAEVADGQSRTFKANNPSADNDHFVEVWSNLDYNVYVSWVNSPGPEKGLWTGARVKPRIGLETLIDPDFRFPKNKAKLVDFIHSQGSAYLVSGALLAVIERIDPGSLEVKPVLIKARDGEVPFNLVMPTRLLEAVDPNRCDVQIEKRKVGEHKFTSVDLYDGAAFQVELTKGIHNFSDIDLPNKWFWSRDLLAAAKEAKVRGIRATVPATLPTRDIDRF